MGEAIAALPCRDRRAISARLALGPPWPPAGNPWPMRAGGSKMRATTQQPMSNVTLTRSRYSIPGFSRQASDVWQNSTPPSAYGTHADPNSPRWLVWVGHSDAPHEEHNQVKAEEQGHAADENEFHVGLLPSRAVPGLPGARQKPEERSPVVKHKFRAPHVHPPAEKRMTHGVQAFGGDALRVAPWIPEPSNPRSVLCHPPVAPCQPLSSLFPPPIPPRRLCSIPCRPLPPARCSFVLSLPTPGACCPLPAASCFSRRPHGHLVMNAG